MSMLFRLGLCPLLALRLLTSGLAEAGSAMNQDAQSESFFATARLLRSEDGALELVDNALSASGMPARDQKTGPVLCCGGFECIDLPLIAGSDSAHTWLCDSRQATQGSPCGGSSTDFPTCTEGNQW